MNRLLMFALAVLLLSAGAVAAAPVTVTGEGVTKDAAVAAALRRAVEHSLGVHITSQTVVVDSALVEDKIYSHAKGYVKSFTITSEGSRGDGYEVTLAAEVDTKLLKDDLDALTILRKNFIVGNPRILVVSGIKDQYLRDKPFVDEIYNGIVESLTDKQFRIVDRAAADRFARQMAETHDININLNRAAAYGLSYQAEYTLYYDVSGTIREGASGKTIVLTIKSQLIDNTRAEVITSKRIEQQGLAPTVDQALDDAGRAGGKSIVVPIIRTLEKHWMEIQNNGAMYTVVLDGIDDPALIAMFTDKFERFPLANGMKEVESGGGKTTFETTYRGKRDQLDRDVLRAAAELGWNMRKVRAEGARSTWQRIK